MGRFFGNIYRANPSLNFEGIAVATFSNQYSFADLGTWENVDIGTWRERIPQSYIDDIDFDLTQSHVYACPGLSGHGFSHEWGKVNRYNASISLPLPPKGVYEERISIPLLF